MTSYLELTPVDGRKSFYGKAKVFNKNGVSYLVSYSTIVASFDGEFHRHWSGWSATTGRHVNAFAKLCGLCPVGKAIWNKMQVEGI